MKATVLVGLILFTQLLSVQVIAVEPAGYSTDTGIVLTPVLQSGIKLDDNIFSQSEQQKSSSILVVAPALNFLVDKESDKYQFDVAIESGTYFSSSDDSYLDGLMKFSAYVETDVMRHFDLLLQTDLGTEARGTGLTEKLDKQVEEALRYTAQTVALSYYYGALSTNSHLELQGEFYNKGYSNFEEITQLRNYDSLLLGATFFYSTNSHTNILVELNREAIRFDVDDEIPRDSDVYNLLTGLKWQATALTSGVIKLGYQNKAFKDPRRKDFAGLSWQLGIEWQPLSYSVFALTSSAQAKDPNVEGDYINERIYDLSWSHQWSELISSKLGVSFSSEDYSGTERSDEVNKLNGSIHFDLLRWLDMSLYVDVTQSQSTRDYVVFDKQIIGINFTFAI